MRPDRDEAEYLELASHYTASIVLPAPAGEGVLIAPGWVLTTARAARLPKPLSIIVAGRPYPVEAVFVHPEAQARQPADLALLRLRDAVRGVVPTPIYRDADEAGKALVFVAHGGGSRPRAAINTVERLSPQTLSLQVKPLEEASDLQGVLGPGEEGAAAYLEVGGKRYVAGLYHGDVTVWNLFSRLSAFLPWIEATMVASERDAQAKLLAE